MSKKLIALLSIFLISFALLLYVKFFGANNSRIQTIIPKQLIPNPILSTNLSIVPDSIIATSSANLPAVRQGATLNIAMDSNIPESGVKIVQFELGYDPHSIFITDITPGGYFFNPEVILNKIDYKTGRISYAIKGESNRANPRTNVAAVISFNPVNNYLKPQSEIYFLPKTIVKNDGYVVKISSTSGTKIIFH